MVNQCTFIGNLGRDPEIRSMSNGDKVANFTIAVTEKWKDRQTGERKEKTQWIPIVVWGAAAGICERYLRKGSKIYLSGSFETRKWQDQSGQDRYTTEITVRPYRGEIKLLDGRRDENGEGYSRGAGEESRGGGYGDSRTGGARSRDDGYGGGYGGGSNINDEIPF